MNTILFTDILRTVELVTHLFQSAQYMPEHANIVFFYSCPPFFFVRIVVGHTHHFQALIFILSIQFFQMGITFPTGNTPTGPEIDNDIFPFQVVQIEHFTMDIGFGKPGGRTARRSHPQLPDFGPDFRSQPALFHPFAQPIVCSLCLSITHRAGLIPQYLSRNV